jgi:hypothetical protein
MTQPLAALAALLLLTSVPLHAQTPEERLRALEREVPGQTLVGDVGTGALPKGGEGYFPVRLQAGVGYAVVGFCDENCQDLDLMILDPSGNLVASDVAMSAEPVLLITAGASGTHQVWAVMGECSREPCSFAVGVLLEGEVDLEPVVGRDLEERLSAFRAEFHGQGFGESGTVEAGVLRSGQEMRVPLPLREGVDYRITGACDNQCENLDLALQAPDGTRVAQDRLEDAIPVLEYTAPVGGEYRLSVDMVTCTAEPCRFEVLWFARGEGGVDELMPPGGMVVSDTTYQGALQAGDPTLRDGEYYHEYTLDAREGQILTLDLRSSDFDTFLVLMAPGGAVEQNDDHEGDSTRSRIVLVALETGTFKVVVTSFSAGETGKYLLRALVTDQE